MFSKPKKTKGFFAIAIDRDGVRVARIRRAGVKLPVVKLAMHFPSAEAATIESLGKVGKDMQAALFHCSALLAGGEYQLVSVEAPAVAADELRTAIRWRLKDMLDYPPDQATIDVLDIPVDKPGGRASVVFVVAARNSIIEAKQNLLLGSGLRLNAIDIPEMAQRNFSAMLEPDGRGVAMLSFDRDGGLLTVTYKAELYLSRRIDVTLEQLLDPDFERRNAWFDKITLELQRSLDHFERQYSFISISKLVLAPSAVSGLEEYLSSNLYTKVETLDLNSLLDLSHVPALAEVATQRQFFLTLGAALREDGAT